MVTKEKERRGMQRPSKQQDHAPPVQMKRTDPPQQRPQLRPSCAHIRSPLATAVLEDGAQQLK